jgi:isopropylmalate/homocitrate/citramalate synthase
MVVAALMKDPFAAECYVPELVGQKRQILFGKKSGAASIKGKLDELGLSVSADELRAIVEAVKAEALRVRRSLDDAELTRIAGTVSARQ